MFPPVECDLNTFIEDGEFDMKLNGLYTFFTRDPSLYETTFDSSARGGSALSSVEVIGLRGGEDGYWVMQPSKLTLTLVPMHETEFLYNQIRSYANIYRI